ncbi:MAG: hypothetical protein LLF94_06935 [Chlamydiales bacterium]|nr:hypothetical protein [Chlamydiales bacterium]
MLKRIIKIALVTVASLFILVAMLPMLISVSKVNQFLLSCVNKRIAGKFHAQEIRVGWTDGISIKGLQIHDPQGREVALFKKISCDVALLSLIHAPAVEGKIEVDSPKISLIDDKNSGHFSLQEVFNAETTEKKSAPPSSSTELVLSELHLSLDIQPQGQAKVNLLCQVESKDDGQTEKGQVNVNATAQNFADLEKAYKHALGEASTGAASVVSLDCHIDQFPIKAALPFVAMRDPTLAKLLLPALGNKINAKISHTLRADELGLTLAVNSPQLTAKVKAAIQGNTLSMLDEGTISWQIRPEVLAALQTDIRQTETTTLLATIKPESGTLGADGKMPVSVNWNLSSPLTLTSTSWNTPLSCRLTGNIHATALQESIEAHTQVDITADKQTSTLTALCTVADPLNAPETTCKVTLNGPIASTAELFLENTLPLEDILGKTTSLDALFKIYDKEKVGTIKIVSDTMKANIDCLANDTTTTLSVDGFADLTNASLGYQGMKCNLQATLNPNQTLNGTLKASPVDSPTAIPFDLTLPFTIDLATKETSGKIHIQSHQATLDSSFVARPAAASNYALLPAISLQLDGEMKQFPIQLLASLTKKPELVDILGAELSGSWKCGFNNLLKSEPISFTILGEGLRLRANLLLAQELTGKDAVTVDYTLTPKRLKALQSTLNVAQGEKQKEMHLAKDLHVNMQIHNLQLPVEPFVIESKPFILTTLLDSLRLKMQLALDEISLKQKDKLVNVAPLQLQAELKGSDRLITLNCATDKNASKNAAQIALTGTMHNLWNEEGFKVDNARILLDTKIQNLPLDILYSITATDQAADDCIAVFGSTVDASVKAEIKDLDDGSFHGTIQSQHLKSEVDCLLTEGTLTLKKPITAEYTLTPEGGKVLLKDVNPLLATAARSESPIKLTIDSNGFSVPLKPFSNSTMQIKNIKIEPGILSCKNSGMLSLLVNLLKVDASGSDEIPLWFTPIYIDVKDGIVTCKRADTLLANAFPIATWGQINLVKNSIDMTLGLSGTAIAQAFGIARLDPGYMVQIPIHGPTQSPKIDSALATTKITALKLQQTSSKSTSLIGGLLEVATQAMEKDAPVPAPTTHPLPWAKNLQTHHHSPQPKPLKFKR